MISLQTETAIDKESDFCGNFAGLQQIYDKNKLLNAQLNRRAKRGVPDCCILFIMLLLLLFTVLTVQRLDSPL